MVTQNISKHVSNVKRAGCQKICQHVMCKGCEKLEADLPLTTDVADVPDVPASDGGGLGWSGGWLMLVGDKGA